MSINLTFKALSELLTGVGDLPIDLADEYYERLCSEGMSQELQGLLVAYEGLEKNDQLEGDKLGSLIMGDPTLNKTAQQIIVLWYTSALFSLDSKGTVTLKFGKPDHYFRSLLWDVIGAHPPALSGGYFGYWHYPPENLFE